MTSWRRWRRPSATGLGNRVFSFGLPARQNSAGRTTNSASASRICSCRIGCKRPSAPRCAPPPREVLGQARCGPLRHRPAAVPGQPAAAERRAPPRTPAAATRRSVRRRRAAHASRTRRWRRLEDFVVGACNRVAHASALEPGRGARRSAHPAGAARPASAPARRTCSKASTPACAQHSRLAHPLRHGGGIHQSLRAGDAPAASSAPSASSSAIATRCLLDDLHFLAKKQATQEEFLHTLDALQTEQRPVVLTLRLPSAAGRPLPAGADRSPGRRRRLGPDDARPRHPAATCCASRRRRPAGCPTTVLDFLAEHLRGNVRELEGAVHSVLHLGRVTGRPIDLELAREALGDLLRHSVRVVRLDDVERPSATVLASSRDAAALQQARLDRQPSAHGRHVPGPQAHQRRPTAKSASTSAAAITAPSSPPRRRCASG